MEAVRTKQLRIKGMTCTSCQSKIEKKLTNTAGVTRAEVSYRDGTAEVSYDPDIISLKDIAAVIERLDYKVLADDQPHSGGNRAAGILIIVFAVFLLMRQFGLTDFFNIFPTADSSMGYGMLFLLGILTSVHCVAMCGGINLSQCIPRARPDGAPARALRPSILYNAGRVISYTAVGGLVGALGAVITFSGWMRGAVQLIAGAFMIIMGVNMLGTFPWLRRLMPGLPKIFARTINAEKSRSNSPLYVGLLNGLMPCGPLQAMQLYALSAGSPVIGALSMLMFALGTVPLMFGLGALSSILSKKFTGRLMTVGASLVIVLGLSMFGNGWTLSGFSLNFLAASKNSPTSSGAPAVMENGVQIVNSTLSSGRYPAITVQAGTPVKWIIDAPKGSINGCNNRMIIREYGIEYKFQTGENVIEFTPAEAGQIPYSCWMGMIRSSITVLGAGGLSDGAAADSGGQPVPQDGPVPAGYKIPADGMAVAEMAEADLQKVSIELTDKGYGPAIVVVQAGIDTEWIINNASLRGGNAVMLVPAYNAQVDMAAGANPLYLYPTEDFDFSTGDNAFYGYVKVVEDLGAIDAEAIKDEVSAYQPLIWPPEYFELGGGAAPSCH
ncbi:MAG: sulfite exporter TauE/SafE family protein [Clostridiales bacterium]|jgi:sulfite exporter TauE/SafE/copper chaperone CopZ|nr:sulfite exporter TauE/SafE family protein [Clostridiales bacterium]